MNARVIQKTTLLLIVTLASSSVLAGSNGTAKRVQRYLKANTSEAEATLKEGDIVFLSLQQKFYLPQSAPGAYPEITATGGNLLPSSVVVKSQLPACRVFFEKSYATEPNTIKRVNPAAEPEEKMYIVKSSENGSLILTPAMGEWNDHGPPTREVVCTDPVKQKTKSALSLQDIRKTFKGAAVARRGQKQVQRLISNWKKIMQQVPCDTESTCGKDVAVEEPVVVAEPVIPQAAPVIEEIPVLPERVLDFSPEDLEPPFVEERRDRIQGDAMLSRGQKGLIEDKLREAAATDRVAFLNWSAENAYERASDELLLKQSSGERLSIEEQNLLNDIQKHIAEVQQNRISMFDDREAFISKLDRQFPGHLNEIYEIYERLVFPEFYPDVQ